MDSTLRKQITIFVMTIKKSDEKDLTPGQDEVYKKLVQEAQKATKNEIVKSMTNFADITPRREALTWLEMILVSDE